MADSASKDAAAKQRIITHMNNDHQDSLIRYLEYFCRLSSFSSRQAHLIDITFDSLVITSSSESSHTIPINPPLNSWADARPRVVAMDSEAVASLKRSHITVKEYRKPTGFSLVVFITVFCVLIVFSRRSNLQAGSFLYDNLLVYCPEFARWCFEIQPVLFGIMIAVHLGEAIYLEQTRLQKHTVPRFSGLWWKWMFNSFTEGYGVLLRFDAIVQEEEVKKSKLKH